MNTRILLLFYFAWVVSLTGLLTSVYFGEVLMFEPCNLCWYQRIALFPLVILLGGSLYQNNCSTIWYALVFAGMGEIIALYQVASGYFPHSHIAPLCGTNCGTSEIKLFSLIPFSLFSAIGFALIFLLLLFAAREWLKFSRSLNNSPNRD